MRNQDMLAMLRYEAGRRPEIAALVARAGSLTDTEIDAAPLPLPWYREALRRLRAQQGAEACMLRGQALVDRYAVHGVTPDPVGEMRAWQGGRCYMKVERGNEFEVETGDLFWLADAGGVWIGSVYARAVDPRLLGDSRSLGRVCRSAYQQARRDAANALCPQGAPVLMAESGGLARPGATRLAGLGVRIG